MTTREQIADIIRKHKYAPLHDADEVLAIALNSPEAAELWINKAVIALEKALTEECVDVGPGVELLISVEAVKIAAWNGRVEDSLEQRARDLRSVEETTRQWCIDAVNQIDGRNFGKEFLISRNDVIKAIRGKD